MILFIKRSAMLLIAMILIVTYLIINLRKVEPVVSTGSLTVVVDAGHGEPDGGVAGKTTGALEKDLNLAVALKLRTNLENAGINVIMTRTDDYGIHSKDSDSIRNKKRDDLRQRVKLANESGADLLISVHMNFFGVEKYSGPQVFYAAKIEESEVLAKKIRASFLEVIGSHCNREIKPVKNEIYLLRETKIPSVIAECGFLSNAKEERLLIDSAYQDKIAKALSRGIIAFLTR